MTKGRRTNSKGRSRAGEPHVRHYLWQLNSPAWRALSPIARCLEMELKALFNGSNNGQLFLSVREAALRIGISENTAVKAFGELRDKGFIQVRQKGSFNQKTRHATSWILTEFEYDNQLPSKEFMRWSSPEFKTRSQESIPTVSKSNTDAL